MSKRYFILFFIIFAFLGFAETNYSVATADSVQTQNLNISQNIDTTDNFAEKEFPQIEYRGAFWKMIFALIAVLLLGGITLWSFKRLNRSRIYSSNMNKEIKILERRVLSPKSILYLIECDGKKMIVSESHLDTKIKDIK